VDHWNWGAILALVWLVAFWALGIWIAGTIFELW
jgi:hypothetical protein